MGPTHLGIMVQEIFLMNKKPKIIHVITELDIGGAEMQLALILPSLQKYVSNEVICLTGKGPVGEKIEKNNIPVHYIQSKHALDIVALYRFFKILKQKNPHATIGYLLHADIINRVISKLCKVPVVISSLRSLLFGPPWHHTIDKATKFLVTHYTAQTQAAKQTIQKKFNLKNNQISVIPNAVKTDLVAPNHTPTNNQELTIICVANLKPLKGLPLLISAFANIHKKNPQTKLWLIGEGPLRKNLESQIQALQLTNIVTLHGTKPHPQEFLHKANIFVLPTEIEGMSNALLEAMSAGLPCITTSIPVNKEIITHQVTGLLFPKNNQEVLEQAISTLLRDKTLRENLGKEAKHYIEKNHSIKAVTNKWQTLIQKIKQETCDGAITDYTKKT